MMKQRISVFAFAVFLVVTVSAQESEAEDEALVTPRGAIVFEGVEDAGARIESLATTIRSVLEFSLALSGAIEPVDNPNEAEFLFAIEIVEEGNRIDLRADRVSQIDNSRTALAERSADSIFDVFPVVDALALDIIRTVSDADVAFGSILLENSGFPASYGVEVDGVFVGSDLTRIDRILTGERTVRITGNYGGQVVAYRSEEILVTEGDPLRLTFHLPPVHPAVLAGMRRWHRNARAEWLGGSPDPDAPTLASLFTGESEGTEELARRFEPSGQPSSELSRVPDETLDRLREAGLLQGPVLRVEPDSGIGSPGPRVLPRIEPIRQPRLGRWAEEIVGNGEIDAFVRDTTGDSEADGPGTDFHEVYALHSEEGIHIIMTFEDGEPDLSNGRYRIGFAAEQNRGGMREVAWTNEGGRPEVVFAVINPQGVRVQRTFTAPTEIRGNLLAFTLPQEAIDLARIRASGIGWEFDAVLERRTAGEYSIVDEIRLRERRVYF